jgi:hypothetical protein
MKCSRCGASCAASCATGPRLTASRLPARPSRSLQAGAFAGWRAAAAARKQRRRALARAAARRAARALAGAFGGWRLVLEAGAVEDRLKHQDELEVRGRPVSVAYRPASVQMVCDGGPRGQPLCARPPRRGSGPAGAHVDRQTNNPPTHPPPPPPRRAAGPGARPGGGERAPAARQRALCAAHRQRRVGQVRRGFFLGCSKLAGCIGRGARSARWSRVRSRPSHSPGAASRSSSVRGRCSRASAMRCCSSSRWGRGRRGQQKGRGVRRKASATLASPQLGPATATAQSQWPTASRQPLNHHCAPAPLAPAALHRGCAASTRRCRRPRGRRRTSCGASRTA